MNNLQIFSLIFAVVIISSFNFSTVFAQPVIEKVDTFIQNQTIQTQAIQTQNVGSTNTQTDVVDVLIQEGIAIIASVLGIGVAAIIAWLRKRGIPVTTEQEKMFKDIVTKRFEKLATQSWSDIRNNPDKLDDYWKNYLSKGKIPDEFVQRLKTEGKEFAIELKNNSEFRDFAKNLSNQAMEKLLTDLRAKLKQDYQKRMIDVLPKLASIAVDASFEKESQDVESWSKKSLENMKPLLLSSHALDTEENLMIIIKSEINKRVQKKLS